MSEVRTNYNYAQINILNIVTSISSILEPVPENHPYYDKMIPIRDYDASLLQHQTETEIITHKYVGKDTDGYGIFEEIREPIPEPQPTEQQIEHADLSTSIEYNNCLREMELDTK